MPRKEALPTREIEICKRFESFRRSTKIPRTVFARALGYIPERLANYESARAPIRYDVFRAVHKLFPVSPRWLVTGEGSPKGGGIFDDEPFRHLFDDRELLSAVYDRVLTDHFSSQQYDIAEYFFAPGGVDDRLESILNDLANGADKSLYSRSLVDRIGSMCSHFSEGLGVLSGYPSPEFPFGVGKKKAKKRES